MIKYIKRNHLES